MARTRLTAQMRAWAQARARVRVRAQVQARVRVQTQMQAQAQAQAHAQAQAQAQAQARAQELASKRVRPIPTLRQMPKMNHQAPTQGLLLQMPAMSMGLPIRQGPQMQKGRPSTEPAPAPAQGS